ncbi:MAG: hypothetical protein JSV23_04600 [Promethearchaeota archaeon]|nr:MAG: hypothetical protein JSV23_04600 [Candidatus Lokiarchaeota archaeon]
MKQIVLKKMYIWLLLTVNLFFAFIIGLTIPLLESSSRYNLGLIMIPLLIILNYIIIDRFHYYITSTNRKEESADGNN